jgi:transposase
MNKHSELVQHLPVNEVEKRFRACKDANVKSWWQAIWLRMKGKTTTEVSQIVSCKPDWVRRLVRRWNALGADGVEDGRKQNGRAPLLSREQQIELMEALTQPAPDGGLWNGHKVAQWISKKIGHDVPYNRGWIYMRELGFTCQTPRPRHREADKIKQDEFKKNFPNYIPILARFAPRQRSKSGRKMKRVLD